MKNQLFLGLLTGVTLALTARAQTVDTILNSGVLEPHSIFYHTNTTFYITDSATHRVLQYDSDNGLLNTFAGVSGQAGTNNGPGFIAKFVAPRGVVAARGGLIVADAGNHSLRHLTLTGSVSVVSLFSGAPGQPGYVDGPLATARFNTPSGLAVDASGNIYLADSKNNAIRKIDLADNVSTVATGFFEPNGLVFDDMGRLFVADTRNHAIKVVALDGTVTHFAGSTNKVAGTTDSFFAEEALFNQPGSLIWLGGTTGLLVTDTGNHSLRRIFFDPIVASFFPSANGYSVQTYAGLSRQAGSQDGTLATARFNSPLGMTRDAEGGLLVADLGNHAIRRIQTTPKLPKVADPKVGYVTFVEDERTGEIISKLITFSDAVFFNEAVIAVLGEANTETFFTLGASPGLFGIDTIPAPNALNSLSSPPYVDGSAPAEVKPSIITPRSDMPDITLKVVSTADGRRPSEIVKSRIVFKAAPVTIIGDNPASFQISSDTTGATIWYTTDGSAPTNEAPSLLAASGTLSLIMNTNFTFRARAFRDGFKPSEIVTKPFSPTEFKANRISFGFEYGEASSDFVASPGQTFYAPVTLSLLPGARMFSLQFNLLVTNLSGPAVAPGNVGFVSTLLEVIPGSPSRIIPPAMYVTANDPPPAGPMFTRGGANFTDLLFTNSANNLLGVGWLARANITNEVLFNVLLQDLITYSQPHDTIFTKNAGKVVVGAYKFIVPVGASPGDNYQIKVARPSATSDGIGGPNSDVFIDTPTSGSLGAGALNTLKNVTVGQRDYIVGDAAPFRWFNAGDFGNGSILSDDVMQIFQTATYGLNTPIPGSDFYDSMDSCCGTLTTPAEQNALFEGNDGTINSITLGDGLLNVADVFVTFRRSLDPTLTWYRRFWSGGTLQAAPVPNLFRGKASRPAEEMTNFGELAQSESDEPPSALFVAPDLSISSGERLSIPLNAQINGKYSAHTLLLNVQVEALEGAPIVAEQVEFVPNPDLGQPTLSGANGTGSYSAAWLNRATPGLHGDTTLGTLRVHLPGNLPKNAAYRVRFGHISASPNGLGVFPQNVQDGLLLASARNGSRFNDGIPDTWRLRYFGATDNLLSHADADADGDGVTNMKEFKAGTNPSDLRSQFKMRATPADQVHAAPGLVLRWPSAKGKTYAIEASSGLADAEWTPAAPNLTGTGMEMQFTAPADGTSMQFYRVRLVE